MIVGGEGDAGNICNLFIDCATHWTAISRWVRRTAPSLICYRCYLRPLLLLALPVTTRTLETMDGALSKT